MKHEIIIYTDARGRAPLRDYLKELKAQKGDDSRIRISKIQDYITLLQEKGTLPPSRYANTLLTKSIHGCGNFVREAIGYCSSPGPAARLSCSMRSKSKAGKRPNLKSGKQNANTKTGQKGMEIYEQQATDME